MNIRALVDTLTTKQLLLVAAAFAAAALLSAFVAQYGFGLHPCHLCILQRYPYAAIVAIAVLAAWRGSLRTQMFIAFLCAALFFLDAGIAFYHTGVENHWFPGPSGCTSDATGNESLEDMRRQLMEAPLVTCDQAMAYFLGLSMATWNFFAASGAGAALFYATLRKKP